MPIRRLHGWSAVGLALFCGYLAVLCASAAAAEELFSPIITVVNFGGKAEFRFLVDTGCDVTMIEPWLAAQLRLEPQFKTQVVSSRGTLIVPGTIVNTLRLGERSVSPVRVLFQNPVEVRRRFPEIRGILGMDALAHSSLSPVSPDRSFGSYGIPSRRHGNPFLACRWAYRH